MQAVVQRQPSTRFLATGAPIAEESIDTPIDQIPSAEARERVSTTRKALPNPQQGSFIFKKSQENFERITLRRLIQIRDGNPETVQLWLAFLQKHAYYGIGMKANIWDFGKLGRISRETSTCANVDVLQPGEGKSMDAISEHALGAIEPKWEQLSQLRSLDTVEKVEEFLATSRFNTDSGKRAEGQRRFVKEQFKREKMMKRKEAE
ncbi:hypothetical protein COL922a_004013 [Colletotrichum nupharicola]|nr:hypothetical protein COL922a_004013 [Colletotrichum nupharicola]